MAHSPLLFVEDALWLTLIVLSHHLFVKLSILGITSYSYPFFSYFQWKEITTTLVPSKVSGGQSLSRRERRMPPNSMKNRREKRLPARERCTFVDESHVNPLVISVTTPRSVQCMLCIFFKKYESLLKFLVLPVKQDSYPLMVQP